MQGKYVERRFGWDCHGLPIENIVEKKLGISGKKDIEEKLGVFAFNEECREIPRLDDRIYSPYIRDTTTFLRSAIVCRTLS